MPRQTISELLEAARAGLDRLEPAAAQRAMANGAVLVDTRCGDARRELGTIPGSVHAPLSVLYWRVDPTSGHDDPRLSAGDHRLILLCADGYSSSIAAATLRQLGFADATDVIGGFNAWRRAGLPIAPAAEASAAS